MEGGANKKIEESINNFLAASKSKIELFEKEITKTGDRMDEKIDATQALIGKLELVAENAQKSENKFITLQSSLGILAEETRVNDAASFVSQFSASDTKEFLDVYAERLTALENSTPRVIHVKDTAERSCQGLSRGGDVLVLSLIHI